MKRILIVASDKQLAQFYYAAHLRAPSVLHCYRHHNVSCYQCNNEDYPNLLALADDLRITCETLEAENKYRRLKTEVANFEPGDPFKVADLIALTGYTRATVAHNMRQLITHGYVNTHGRSNGHYYTRIENREQPSHA